MDGLSDKRKLSPEELDDLVGSLQEKELLRWYGKWKDQPWLYAVVTTLLKIPIILVVAVIVQWDKMKPVLLNPIPFIKERWVFFLVAFIFLALYNRFVWNKKAFSYFLRSRIGAPGFYLDDDSSIARQGERAAARLAKNYTSWHDKKILLIVLIGVLLPLVFFLILFLGNGITRGNWTAGYFMDGFEEGVFFFIAGTFMLMGSGIGYGIWKEINDNFQLLKKTTTDRER